MTSSFLGGVYMNRSEFLMALYDALDDIPKEERTAIVSEYQEYFRNELKKGLSEEEICLSLGDPVTLAYAIKQKRGYGQFAEQPSPRKARPSGFFKLAKIITRIVIAFTIISVIGISFSFSKGFSWNFSFGPGKRYEVNEEKDIDLGSANNIIIRVTSSDTRVIPSNGNKVQASLKGTVKTTNERTVPTLEITRNGRSILIEEHRTEMHFGPYYSNLKMDITIPRDFDGSINYEGTSGDFTSSDLNADSLSIDLSSGDIKLEDITLERMLSIVSASGNININSLKAKEAALESTSGDKELTDFSVGGTVHIKSTSGNSTIKRMDCKNLVVNCTSGDIKISDLEAGLYVDSASGNISLSLTKVTEEIKVNARSGDVKLKIPSNSDFTLDSSVGSGNIECDFDLENKNISKRSLRGSHGSGRVPIIISTASGNISIKK
jgi:lia operon protein LiaG